MPEMRILSSPRRRRRLVYPLAFVAVAAPLIYVGVHFSTPGDKGAATGPEVNVPGYSQPKSVPFTKKNRRAVRQVLRDFEATAVVRRNVGLSWNLSAPSLREGVSRREWNKGDLPVVPYPAADKGLGSWSFVQYSYPRTVGLEVFLFPRSGSGFSAMTADVELVKGHDGRWRVDYWMPKGFHGPPSVAASAKAKAKPKPSKHAAPAKAAGKRTAPAERHAAPAPAPAATPKVSRAWWLIPIALLSLIVLAPLGIMLGTWYRNRRAAREYTRREA
jgi:hypothetical protein